MSFSHTCRPGTFKEFHFFDYPNWNESVAQKYIDGWQYCDNLSYDVVKFEATPVY